MGEQFGKYQLERKLAVGGMAEIFLATAVGPEGFKKHLAIKRILPHLTENQDFVTMFLDEARLVARFNHPNIVQIFELGSVEGRLFLAMEYVHGASMSKVLKACSKNEQLLPLEFGVKIISYACEGLEYAHNFTAADGSPLNLIHRDVSPQNLMLSYDGVLKVLDFGIAKATGNIYQTRTSSLKGKAAYMSPEQITAKTGLDRRSDVFALGIVLFEFATGQRPYQGDTELELMMAIVQQPAPDPRTVKPDLAPELVAVIKRALEKDRTQRYQSCRELRTELEQFLMARRAMVDTYALGAYLCQLMPPADTGIGYSVPTPSRPDMGAAGEPATTKTPTTPPSRRIPAPPQVPVGDNQPTQLTPSAVIRPLLVGQAEAASRQREVSRTRRGAGPALKESGPTTGQRSHHRETAQPTRSMAAGFIILLLVAVVGAGAAFLLFGGSGNSADAFDGGLIASLGPGGPDGVTEPPASDAGSASAPLDAGLSEPAAQLDAGASSDPRDAGPLAVAEPDAGKKPPTTNNGTHNGPKKKRKRRKVDDVGSPPPPPPDKPEIAKAEPGKLSIYSQPWVNVRIDGVSYGSTPLASVELPAGSYELVLSNPGEGIQRKQTVRVLAGRTQVIKETFPRGFLQVFVKPFGEVFIDGQRKGITPLEKPIQLVEGLHTVRVICKNTGRQEEQKIQISGGQTQTLKFDLR